MKILPLVNTEFVALLDDEDFERVSKFKWRINHKSVCRSYTIPNHLYAQRRQVIVVTLANEVMQNFVLMYDHKDRNFLNAQKENLRVASKQQNAWNNTKNPWTENTYKGAYLDKRTGRYRAIIRVNRKAINLGFFATELEAARAYDEAAKKHFGEFASLNFPSKSEVGY